MTTLAPLDSRWQDLATLERYTALPEPDRRALAAAIAAALGPDYSPAPELLGSAGLTAVIHIPTRTLFAVIPGGDLEMGIRPDERDELVAAINTTAGEEQDGPIDDLLRVALPVHRVKVRPFLFASRNMLVEQARALSPALAERPLNRGAWGDLDEAALLKPAEVPAVFAGAPPGFRLPCEAEWEWVAREGGPRSWVLHPRKWLSFESEDELPNAFGAFIIPEVGEWTADAWFPGHEGAPDTAVAREPGAAPGVARGPHSGWQDAIEAVVTACGFREQAAEKSLRWIRFARDLP